MPPSPPESSPARAAANNGNGNAYWRSVIRLTLLLLGIWALVSIVAAIVLVELLNTLKVGRLPAGFWLAQQGSIVVFVALIFIYARRMDRIDHQYRKDIES